MENNKEILVRYGVKTKMAIEFGVSAHCIYMALRYPVGNALTDAIRKAAIEEFGGVYAKRR